MVLKPSPPKITEFEIGGPLWCVYFVKTDFFLLSTLSRTEIQWKRYLNSMNARKRSVCDQRKHKTYCVVHQPVKTAYEISAHRIGYKRNNAGNAIKKCVRSLKILCAPIRKIKE